MGDDLIGRFVDAFIKIVLDGRVPNIRDIAKQSYYKTFTTYYIDDVRRAGKKAADNFYNSYAPRYYDRRGEMEYVPRPYVNLSSLSFGYELNGDSLNNPDAYEQVYELGWHGGSPDEFDESDDGVNTIYYYINPVTRKRRKAARSRAPKRIFMEEIGQVDYGFYDYDFLRNMVEMMESMI